MQRRAIIFDLDGVLLDSWELASAAFEFSYRRHVAAGPAPIHRFQRELGAPFGTILARLGLPPEMKATFESYSRENVHRARAYPGITELLGELRARSHPLAVLTGKDAERTRQVMNRTGLLPYFGAIVTPEDAPGKPDPAGPRLCLSRLDAPLDGAMLVGDAANDMQAARNAGICAVFATWGALTTLLPESYDATVAAPGELLRVVEE